jgi:hypothetical protein
MSIAKWAGRLAGAVKGVYVKVADNLRAFAAARGLLVDTKLSLTGGGPIDWFFQLVIPVMAFGFMFGPKTGTLAGVLAVGVSCTALMFVAYRLVSALSHWLEERSAKSGWVTKLALVVVGLAVLAALPASIFKAGAMVFPGYISANSWWDALYNGVFVLTADVLISQLTGVRLFLDSRRPARPAASVERPQPPDSSSR